MVRARIGLLAAISPGQVMYRAVCSPTPSSLVRGSISIGRLPPTLFIKKRKVPIQTDRMLEGTISTRTVKRRENQVSAEKVGDHPLLSCNARLTKEVV